MNHCPNCGSHIEPYKVRCEYCGSWYWDFAAFDCDTDKPVYVKFKTTQMGEQIVLTALAKPRVEQVEVNSDVSYIKDKMGNALRSFTTNRTCEIDAKFTCIPNGKDRTLFTVEKIENFKQG